MRFRWMFKKHSKVKISNKGDYFLRLKVTFLVSISTLFCCFLKLFLYFVFFVCLGGFPLNMVVVAVCWGLFWLFFEKPIEGCPPKQTKNTKKVLKKQQKRVEILTKKSHLQS